jgi:hypothetical protein
MKMPSETAMRKRMSRTMWLWKRRMELCTVLLFSSRTSFLKRVPWGGRLVGWLVGWKLGWFMVLETSLPLRFAPSLTKGRKTAEQRAARLQVTP